MVATVALGRGSVRDDVTQIVLDELKAAQFPVARSVTVQREREYIEQLVEQVANSNEAEAILLIGGVGLGPRDYTCEAVDRIVNRRMDGFGEAYRRLLLDEGGSPDPSLGGHPTERGARREAATVRAAVTRATGGVCDGCIVLAIPRQSPALMRRAMQQLVIPVLPMAMHIAAGHGPASIR
jgi:molybdenum cofactor biosynthesis protein B